MNSTINGLVDNYFSNYVNNQTIPEPFLQIYPSNVRENYIQKQTESSDIIQSEKLSVEIAKIKLKKIDI